MQFSNMVIKLITREYNHDFNKIMVANHDLQGFGKIKFQKTSAPKISNKLKMHF